jgi:hypothetical protein
MAGLMLLLIAASTAQTNLPQLAQAAYDKHSYVDGGALFLLSAQADPNGAAGHLYNAACCYALGGQKDLAFHSLGLAAAKGWRNVQHTESDEDLASLRSDPRWKETLGAIGSASPSQENKEKTGTPLGDDVRSNRDAMINDLNNLSAMSYQYRIRPKSMGGGEGSYTDFKIPLRMTSNPNATYETLIVEANRVRIRATSAKGNGTVEASIDQTGRLGDWNYTGKFAEPVKVKEATTALTSNRDALINQLNNIAAYCYQYRIRPSSMGGGQGAYTGVKLPEKLTASDDGTFSLTDIEANALKIQAISKRFKGSITTTLDASGRMGQWTYFGDLQ